MDFLNIQLPEELIFILIPIVYILAQKVRKFFKSKKRFSKGGFVPNRENVIYNCYICGKPLDTPVIGGSHFAFHEDCVKTVRHRN